MDALVLGEVLTFTFGSLYGQFRRDCNLFHRFDCPISRTCKGNNFITASIHATRSAHNRTAICNIPACVPLNRIIRAIVITLNYQTSMIYITVACALDVLTRQYRLPVPVKTGAHRCNENKQIL